MGEFRIGILRSMKITHHSGVFVLKTNEQLLIRKRLNQTKKEQTVLNKRQYERERERESTVCGTKINVLMLFIRWT